MWYQPNSSRTPRLGSAFICASKTIQLEVSVHMIISWNGPVLTGIDPPPSSWYQPKRLRMPWPMSAFFCALKPPQWGVLVHMIISQNGPVLTEIDPPPSSWYQLKRSRTPRSMLAFSSLRIESTSTGWGLRVLRACKEWAESRILNDNVDGLPALLNFESSQQPENCQAMDA